MTGRMTRFPHALRRLGGRTWRALQTFRRTITENPILAREWLTRMRGRQAFWAVFGVTGGLGLVAGVIYLIFISSGGNFYSPTDRSQIGQAIFYTVGLLELAVITIAGPALTAGALSSERERQTWDLLRSSLLSASAIVYGKLSSALIFLLLLMTAALPVQSLAFLFGGVTAGEVAIGGVIMVMTAVLFCSLGLFVSSITRTVRVSMLIAQAATAVLVYFFPALLLALIMTLASTSSFFPSPLQETILIYTAWLLAAVNPFGAAIGTFALFASDHSFLYTRAALAGPAPLLIPSPWLGLVVFYPLLAWLFLDLARRAVSRPEKQ